MSELLSLCHDKGHGGISYLTRYGNKGVEIGKLLSFANNRYVSCLSVFLLKYVLSKVNLVATEKTVQHQ